MGILEAKEKSIEPNLYVGHTLMDDGVEAFFVRGHSEVWSLLQKLTDSLKGHSASFQPLFIILHHQFPQ